jgi:broad specificity phosphatase PhoE
MPFVEPHTPPSSWRVSEEGRKQGLALAKRLEAYALEHVVPSEETKAAETAKIVAERLGLAWSVAPPDGWRSLNRSVAAGTPRMRKPRTF